jgi:hypothetical protein
MTKIIMLIAGIALILGTIGSFIGSISKTPENLRGFYGFFYSLISLTGLIGGIALIVFSFIA